MLLKCAANRGAALRRIRPGSLVTKDTILQDFTVGREYRPYAMELYFDSINVLVCDDIDYPVWLPIDLFTVEEPRIPSGWEFAASAEDVPSKTGRRGRRAIWGYPEIVHSEAHFVGLIEGDPDARRVFSEARRRMDESAGR